jgi:hypothetical protein
MKFRLEVSFEARKEIEEIVEWYEDKQKGLGEKFLDTVILYEKYLSFNAHSHPKVRGEFRELVIRKFPYIIIYSIVNQTTVLLVGLVHTKRHPTKRKKRK